MPTIFQNGTASAAGSASIPLPRRGIVTFDAVNAHSQASEPPLCLVMEFNAAEREWQERLNIEDRLRANSPSRAAKKEQRRASQGPDSRTS